MLCYRNTIQLEYPEFTAKQEGLIVEPEEKVDLCSMEPGFDVGPYISVNLHRVLAWVKTVAHEKKRAACSCRVTGSSEGLRCVHSILGYKAVKSDQVIVCGAFSTTCLEKPIFPEQGTER